MPTLIQCLASFLGDLLRSRLSMQMEIVALRHLLAIHQRTTRRPRVQPADRVFWARLSRYWSRWREVLIFVQPETVIAWRRRRFREHWTKLSRSGRPGRPVVSREVRDLIRRMSSTNPPHNWGSPRIMGELREIVAVDFFVVPTVRNQVLFVFLLLALDRRRVIHFNVTANPFIERLIGTIRRDCLDHVIVVDQLHLKRILADYLAYYHCWRTHLSLEMDCPEPREIQAADRGRVAESPEIGGLHHHYRRVAA